MLSTYRVTDVRFLGKHSPTALHGSVKRNCHPGIEPKPEGQLRYGRHKGPRKTEPEQGHPGEQRRQPIERGDPRMGPANLMEPLEQVQAMGLKDGLPCPQTGQHAEESIPKEREPHQQEA